MTEREEKALADGLVPAGKRRPGCVDGPVPDIVVDEEIAQLIPPLSAAELACLERSLLQDGCREPLAVWENQGILLEGHYQHGLCTKHNIPFQVAMVQLPDRQAAVDWVISSQLARNITPEAASYLRGKRYLGRKTARGGNHRSGSNRHNGGSNGGNRPSDAGTNRHNGGSNCAKQLAGEYRLGVRTIERDARFAAAVDQIAGHCGRLAKQLILSRDARLTRKDTLRLALLAPADQWRVLQEIVAFGRPQGWPTKPERIMITLPVAALPMARALVRKLGRRRAAQVRQVLGRLLTAANQKPPSETS